MKFCVVGDMHLSFTAPVSRKDNFREIVPQKLSDIVKICHFNQVELVVLLGDVFSSPSPHFSVMHEFVSFLESLSLPVIAIPGNHDVYGWSEATLPRTALGVLHRTGSLQVLSPVTETTFETEDVQFYISRFLSGEETAAPLRKPGKLQVELVHATVASKKTFGEHVLIEQYETRADYVFSGHYHPGHPITLLNEVAFCNPGAVLRVIAIPEEITRYPAVAIVNTRHSPGQPHIFLSECIELIPLASAVPGSEVFDIVEQISEEDLEEFLASLSAEAVFVDVEEVVRELGQEYPASVTELVLDILRATKGE